MAKSYQNLRKNYDRNHHLNPPDNNIYRLDLYNRHDRKIYNRQKAEFENKSKIDQTRREKLQQSKLLKNLEKNLRKFTEKSIKIQVLSHVTICFTFPLCCLV